MATNKPRITVTLDPDTHAAVSDLAHLLGKSKSGLVCELLQQARTPLRRLAELARMAQQAEADTLRGMERVLGSLVEVLEGSLRGPDPHNTNQGGQHVRHRSPERSVGTG